jgi:integrase
MARAGTDRLSARAVQTTVFRDRPFKLFDGGGLFLHIQERGRYWRLKYRHGAKEKLLALGVYPDVGLRDARQARNEARKLLAQGIDPSAHRKAERAARAAADANSFEVVAREWWEQVHLKAVVSEHANRNLRRLEIHVFPAIGRLPLCDVSAPQLLAVLRKVEQGKHAVTSHRLRSLCGQVFRYGIATERAERDVAADLRDTLATPKTQHHPALVNPTDLGPLLRAIEGYEGQPTTKAALQLAPIVFARPGELRKARWDDFDLDAGTWDFRPSKGGGEMVTPLPRQAVAILSELHTITGPDDYVLPSSRGKGRPMSSNTLNAALHQMGYRGLMTAHGFRAAARTILVERLDFRAEWVEMQLGHAVRDANGRAYNRTTFFEQRRKMLQEWADYLDKLRDSIVPQEGPKKTIGTVLESRPASSDHIAAGDGRIT